MLYAMSRMQKISTELAQVGKQSWWGVTNAADMEAYVRTGEPKYRKSITPITRTNWWVSGLLKLLPPPKNWDEHDRRLVHLVAWLMDNPAKFEWGYIWSRINAHLEEEGADEDVFEPWRAELLAAGLDEQKVTLGLIRRINWLVKDGRPTSAGRFLLSLPPAELVGLVTQMSADDDGTAMTRLLAAEAPDLLPQVADSLLRHAAGPHGGHDQTPALLLAAGDRYAANVVAAMENATESLFQFRLARALHAHDPSRFATLAYRAANAAVVKFARGHSLPKDDVAEWMVQHMGSAAVPAFVRSLSDMETGYHKNRLLAAAATLGTDGLPAMLAALDATDELAPPDLSRSYGQTWAADRQIGLRLAALQHLAEIGNPEQADRIFDTIRRSFAEVDPDWLPKFIAFAGTWDADRTRPLLWPLLRHKSKIARSAAARSLARAEDPAVVEEAGKLLAEKKADVRAAAVALLAANGSGRALDLLERHLDAEASDDVRDLALLGLADAWRRQGRTLAKPDVQRRVTKAADAGKLAAPPAAWLDSAQLPPLRWADGQPLTDAERTYLLYRQSRAKGMASDVEAAPMYPLLDRHSSGDFASAVLDAYLATKHDPKDKWALALAGLLGDDGVVPPLARKIREWVDAGRGKLAEYAVQALALVGTDVALQAVDAASLKYRSKMKNVGRAAVEAFDAAANAAGVTPEELGDRVVPLLGLPPDGSPRLIACGDATFAATVGPDLKLRFINTATNKPAKTLPKSCGPEVLAEMKDSAANLRDVAKNQTIRLENLLVRQRRWPAARWAELFLKHPVLRPFAWRLVWGHFEGGALRQTFRPLEDGTLTDTADEAVALPAAGEVGMVHPLELPEADRRAWAEHLADYEVEPPFAQMDRPVVYVAEADKLLKHSDGAEGSEVNAMTLRSRTERRGWRRGSVMDGGMVASFIKTFPAAGVDCLLGVDGYFMGVGPDDSVKLEAARFVRHGSYDVGSYSYDEPADDKDPRVVPLGEVPAIAYSEAIADLAAIAGKRAAGEGDAE